MKFVCLDYRYCTWTSGPVCCGGIVCIPKSLADKIAYTRPEQVFEIEAKDVKEALKKAENMPAVAAPP